MKNHWEFYHKIDGNFEIFGISFNKHTNEYYLASTYVKNGNIRDYLLDNFVYLNWDSRLNILVMVLVKLMKIHDLNLVHGNLHNGNILVADEIFIADFALSSQTGKTLNKNALIRHLPYIAPEVLRGDIPTSASDIYAFGVLMSEMATGKMAFSERAHDSVLAKDIINGLRPEIHDGTPESYEGMVRLCFHSDPLKRPFSHQLYLFLVTEILANSSLETANPNLIFGKLPSPDLSGKYC